MKKVMKVILDTNFLLIPFQFHIDIFSEIDRICNFACTVCILDRSFDELNKIMLEQGGKHRLAARLAMAFIKAKKVRKLRTWSKDPVDDILSRMSGKKDVIVATQDRELKKRLKCPVITMRQKTHLVLEKNI